MKTTVIHHSADFDGIFCREIAKHFLRNSPEDVDYIGWNFGDAPLSPARLTTGDAVYVLDLPIDAVFALSFGLTGQSGIAKNVIWIDHHKSSIESHPKGIPGYRIDGVAACRLAWQWFAFPHRQTQMPGMPQPEDFFNRNVSEPLAVRLAGEYDVFDHRDERAQLFQFGLKSQHLSRDDWRYLLGGECEPCVSESMVNHLLKQGKVLEFARGEEYKEVITSQGFDVEFEGLTFLACCSHECDIRSQLFAAGIKPHHDGLLGFTFNGKSWRVSLYGVPGKPDIDFSVIAKKHGGGGHKQACGFIKSGTTLPWIPR